MIILTITTIITIIDTTTLQLFFVILNLYISNCIVYFFFHFYTLFIFCFMSFLCPAVSVDNLASTSIIYDLFIIQQGLCLFITTVIETFVYICCSCSSCQAKQSYFVLINICYQLINRHLYLPILFTILNSHVN